MSDATDDERPIQRPDEDPYDFELRCVVSGIRQVVKEMREKGQLPPAPVDPPGVEDVKE